MPEVTLADLIAWEPRLRPVGAGGVVDGVPTDSWSDRELSWAISARARQPMLPSVRGGELVLLPARILSDAGAALPVILRELAGHGVAAVVLDQLPGVPSSIPVLFVESLTPDLEGELNRLLTEKRSELYHAGTDLSRQLNQASAAGADLDLVLGAAAAYLHVPAAVVDGRGAVLAASCPEAVPAGARSLAALNGFSRGWRTDHYLSRLSSGETLWVGPVPKERRALARLAAERIAVAAEAVLQRAADARPRGPARSVALHALLVGLGAEAARTAAMLGLPAGGAYRIALLSPKADLSSVHRWLAPTGTLHDAGEIDGATALLLELRPDAAISGRVSQARRRDVIADRRGFVTDGWVALSGIVSGTTGMPEGARQARFVAALLDASSVTGPLVRFDVLGDIGVYRLMYQLWGTQGLELFAKDALGDLAAYDRRGTLRATLLTYLGAGSSHVEAAARLGIHRNTLAYRLKQIAAMTGRDPTDPSTQLVLHLALLSATMPALPAES